MTADEFRKLALSFPDTSEESHMGHPDFRVRGKIFATLNYPSREWGMVKLTPDQQLGFVKSDPAIFVPVKGKWGKQGSTNIQLKSATKEKLRSALEAAWHNAAPKRLRLDHLVHH
jgi:hypothetical protein